MLHHIPKVMMAAAAALALLGSAPAAAHDVAVS